MQVYTRYKARRRRWNWKSASYALATLAFVAVTAWMIWHRGTWLNEPDFEAARAQRPSESPASGLPAAPRVPPPLAPQVAAGTPGSIVASTNRQPQPTNPLPAPVRAITNAASPLPAEISTHVPRPVANILEAQVCLARLGISSGSIDGATGYQTRAALRAFQRRLSIPATGQLDAATTRALTLDAPAYATFTVTSNDLATLTPVSRTWLGKSQQRRLDYETILESVAERHRAHPELLRRLNSNVDWTNAVAGLKVVVPQVTRPVIAVRPAWLRIGLQDRVLEGFDSRTNLLFHFPCSIASRVEKRPAGRLEVVIVAIGPSYTFNPEVFPESAEARRLNTKLTIPPGPNNPVGAAWIGLSLSGYGIHGTPRPEDVGRTESHGCFRLANWDAELLAQMVRPGLPVLVEY